LNDAEFPASATIKESPETIDHKDFIGWRLAFRFYDHLGKCWTSPQFFSAQKKNEASKSYRIDSNPDSYLLAMRYWSIYFKMQFAHL
jgi:hypothetical protein